MTHPLGIVEVAERAIPSTGHLMGALRRVEG
jgi:hypothetical protein